MKFSVIMPAKNRERLIGSAIQSILDQTYRDFELIIIDDHSTDNTIEAVKKFDDPRIILLELTDTTGPGAGRDFGIRRAQGDYIVMADSDDISKPNRLEKTKEFIDQNSCDLVYADIEVHNEDTGEVTLKTSQNFDEEVLKRVNIITAPTVCFTRQVYLDCGGFNLEIRTSEDYDLWLTLAEKGKKLCYLNETLVEMLVHSDNVTKSVDFEKRKSNLQFVRQKHHLATPDQGETLRLLKTEYLKNNYSTEGAVNFWFSP